MYISELRVRNFRNFHKARFRFKPGVNTLIGENGSGKTNALFALRLLLDDSLSRRALALSESDFCRAIGDWKGHWIAISIDFADLDPSEGCQVLRHQSAHMNGNNSGTHTLYFRPRLEVRKKLGQMTEDGCPEAEFRVYLDGLTTDDYESVLTGRAEGDFLDDEVYQRMVGNFDSCEFANPDVDDLLMCGVRMPAIHGEVSCTFAPALRDVVTDLKGYRSNPLLALLRGSEAKIRLEDAEQIVEAVRALNEHIASLDEIKGIASGVQGTLQKTVGYAYAPTVEIQSGLPDQLERLLQRLSMKVGGGGAGGFQGDISEQSLGDANLIYLALKLLEYELKLSSDRVAHFLLIEEPEAHIHTHVQKTLFEKQSLHQTQVIVSTHSTHISSVAKIRSVNVLSKRGDHAEVCQPATGLDADEIGRLERYMDAVRSTLLFAKGVVLVEGTAELVLLPSLLKAVFGVSPDELGISVISVDSAFFGHVAKVFDEDRIHRRCAIVTDRDAPLISLPENPEEDDGKQKHAREAGIAGEHRRESLLEFCRDNEWVEPFLAEHTFEVEFLLAGNQDEVCEVLDSVYAKPSNLAKAKDTVRDPDSTVCGTSIVALANRLGKGWFSLLLTEHLSGETRVPGYLLEAVGFAGQDTLTDDTLKRMAVHRLRNGGLDVSTLGLPSIEDFAELSSSEAIGMFVSAYQEDDLTQLVHVLSG